MIRMLGSILLLVGITVGAGMLALPMVVAEAGLYAAILLLIIAYIVMLIPAFYTLEVLFSVPRGSHLVTMARNTLSLPGVLALWFSNCILLYAVLAAYISGGGTLFFDYLERIHLDIPINMAYILFTVVIGLFVVAGIRVTSVTNGILMTLKGIFYFILIIGILLHLHFSQPVWVNVTALKSSVLVVVVSFTYSMLLPSLYIYLNYSAQKIKITLILGSLISLLIYITWLVVVFTAVPLYGQNGLLAVSKQESVYILAKAMSTHTSFFAAPLFANAFVSVCLLTTFLGASLCLSDVIADGFQLKKKGGRAF